MQPTSKGTGKGGDGGPCWTQLPPGRHHGPTGPPCPCTGGFEGGSTGWRPGHTGAYPHRPPGSGGNSEGGPAWRRERPAPFASLSRWWLVAGRRASSAGLGGRLDGQPFDRGSQEAPPLQPGSPRSKLPMTLEFSTFLGLCLEKTAPPAADWLRELRRITVFPKAQKSLISSSRGCFLWARWKR